MRKWIEKIVNSSRETKVFALTLIVYGGAIVLTTLYVYARLDFVRSYETPKQEIKETTS